MAMMVHYNVSLLPSSFAVTATACTPTSYQPCRIWLSPVSRHTVLPSNPVRIPQPAVWCTSTYLSVLSLECLCPVSVPHLPVGPVRAEIVLRSLWYPQHEPLGNVLE